MRTHKQPIAKQATYWLGVIIIGLTVGLGIQFTQAWVNPTATAPGGNVAGPITTGNANQQKAGGILTIGTAAITNPSTPAIVGGLNIKGQAFSKSTQVTDLQTTLVTKDYVDNRTDNTRLIGDISTEFTSNKVYGPAKSDMFVGFMNVGDGASEDHSYLCASATDVNAVSKCYCTEMNNKGTCDGGNGTGSGSIRTRAFSYDAGFGIVKKGEYWQTQSFRGKGSINSSTSVIIYPFTN